METGEQGKPEGLAPKISMISPPFGKYKVRESLEFTYIYVRFTWHVLS